MNILIEFSDVTYQFKNLENIIFYGKKLGYLNILVLSYEKEFPLAWKVIKRNKDKAVKPNSIKYRIHTSSCSYGMFFIVAVSLSFD